MALADYAQADSYLQSGFAHTIGWGSRSPLNTLANPASAIAPASIRRLSLRLRAGKVPLVRRTRVEYTEPDMSDAGIFFYKTPLLTVFQKGIETGLESCVTGLEPRDGELVVLKRYPSAFFATDLDTRLQLKVVDMFVV
ncbi:uncharacterized protein BDR25DRAFT_322236 [Lindgomyces ingoldianus]|uniref:Uncharacterized protein n=1 Tax=Lindgomyces ingoldianus TaxID=673940 RepID=A0ACB6RAG6_9PLEO|nr:uncharacterized protein BDR25DRAFT_322236 [Lindgomyces ingoldianus]KAF2475763.1 hypothetical protein BDR25DRAFT_322236 [Lindgomyces ingoldianus]